MIAIQILLLACPFILLHFFQTSLANPYCPPSACGNIRNISSPFRLKDDPKHCGDHRFELACENDVASISLNSQKYYVKEINYTNYFSGSIRLVDASINNDSCSFPKYSASDYNFSRGYPYPYLTGKRSRPINLMSCPQPLNNSSLFTEIIDCASNSPHNRYTYIKVGHMNASEVPHMCGVDLIVMTSWRGFEDWNNVSLSEIHHSLLYGFELSICSECGKPSTVWENILYFFAIYGILLIPLGIVVFLSAGVSLPVMIIIGITGTVLVLVPAFISSGSIQNFEGSITFYRFFFSGVSFFRETSVVVSLSLVTGAMASIIICAPKFIIFPCAVWLFIYKFRRRHLSIFEGIESFLQSDNKLVPIRYSYSDIKKMTKGFQDKLGEGGYGYVYKGKLRSGQHVAVKLLRRSGANGQDFINEIATIGRIHHVNVVKLVGYCAQGSKRALVFEFMPNGSLEKYIFNREKINSLNWDIKFEIAVGVARGIEYLHRGCDVQILHFDIKPHNILLDEKFIPKISDFGLAKFCSTDKNTVTMTIARGTIGYVAPELINRSIGAISHKADVYSFGMLLMEMVNLKTNLIGNNDDSNQYFPYWIYDHFNQGKDIEIEKAGENIDNDEYHSQRKLARKMTIVALWCIQMSPNDRPSMNKVLEMLECDVERLQIPNYPSQSTQIIVNMDQTGITCSTDSIPLLPHDDVSSYVEITVQP